MLSERRIIAVFLILGSSLLFTAMNTISSRLGLELPSGEVAFFRVFISLIFLGPYLVKRKISLLGRRRGLVFFRALAGFLGLTLGFFALTKIPIAEVAVLWKSSVIFTAMLSVILLKERVTLRLLSCILVATLGAILILKPTSNVMNTGGLAALCAGVTVAIVSVSIRKLHLTEHSDTIVFGFCFWGSVLGLIFFGYSFLMPDSRQWLLLFSMGICGLFGQVLFTRAFRYAPASVVQPLTFAEVLFTASSGAIFFGQIPDFYSIIGGIAIILSGIGIVVQNKTKISEILPD